MVDTIKISALPVEIAPTSDDYVAMVDNATSTTKQVAFDEFGKAINYTNSLSTDANNLLAVDGSNKLNLTAQNELISEDDDNTISVGTDGKLFRSSAGGVLPENNFFVGNAVGQPVATAANDVRQVLGLPIDYIKDDIQYISANQVSWEGSCRDSSDSRDFKIVGATTTSLIGATADTTYNLFVAGNTLTDTPVVVWDLGSTPAGYTYYRLVGSFVTDGIGNIIEFTSHSKNNSLKIVYSAGGITEYMSVLPANSNLNQAITVPSIDLEVELFASSVRGGGAGYTKIVDTSSSITPSDLNTENADLLASEATAFDLGISRIIINISNSQVKLLQNSNEVSTFRLSTRSYTIWR